MKDYTVTITRQFGSLGRPIAQRIASALGYEYYDRDIVEMAANELNMSVSRVGEAEEKAKSKWYDMRYPLGVKTSKEQDAIFREQSRIITELAKKGPAVFVGRCSEHILSYKKNVLRVGIVAPYEKRVENCIKVLHMEGKDAMETILEVDKARDIYHKNYTGHYPFDHRYQDLIIDSSLLGVEGTAEKVVEIVRELSEDSEE